MNPNLTLSEIGQLCAIIELAQADTNSVIRAERAAWAAVKLAEQCRALDEWIRKGGFLPDAWELGQKRGDRI